MIKKLSRQLNIIGQNHLASLLTGASVVDSNNGSLILGVQSSQAADTLAHRAKVILRALQDMGQDVKNLEFQIALPTLPEVEVKPESEPLEIVDRRKSKFLKIDNAFFYGEYAAKVGPYGIAIYAALALHADNRTGECWPSYQRLADLCKMSRRQAMRKVKELADLGIIEIERRKRDGNRNDSNIVILIDCNDWN